jgi:hypothetical protein
MATPPTEPAEPEPLLRLLHERPDGWEAAFAAIVASPACLPERIELLFAPRFDWLRRETSSALVRNTALPLALRRRVFMHVDRGLLQSDLKEADLGADFIALVAAVHRAGQPPFPRHPPAPDQLAALAALGPRGVLLASAVPGCPEAVLWEALAQAGPWGDLALARNPSAPGALLAALAAKNNPRTHLELARHPHLPASVAAVFAADPKYKLRAALARNPGLSHALAATLAADADARVRATLARNPRARALRVALQRDPDPRVREAAQAARRKRGLQLLSPALTPAP